MRIFEGKWLTAEATSNENCESAFGVDIRKSLMTLVNGILIWIGWQPDC